MNLEVYYRSNKNTENVSITINFSVSMIKLDLKKKTECTIHFIANTHLSAELSNIFKYSSRIQALNDRANACQYVILH